MAKSSIIFAACLLLAAISAHEASPSESLYSHWTSFKSQYGKKYASPAEEAKRLELLTKNKLAVDRFNQEQSEQAGYSLAVNHLSDRTDEEFEQLLGFRMSPEQHLMLRQQSDEESSEFMKKILENDTQAVPESIDWRDHGRVSSVKNQADCGSCWAFSTAGVLEGQLMPIRNISKAIGLSEQNIMDCGSYSDHPCRGGDMPQALMDVAAEGGVESEQDYPYVGRSTSGSCKYNKTLAVIANNGFALVPSASEEALKKVVAEYGPVSVAIHVSGGGNFRHYHSGVFTDTFCHSESVLLNHAVLVVGYGTEPEGGDYWLVKNSWSDTWGDKGYIKMARNKNNMCGIATEAVLASF